MYSRSVSNFCVELSSCRVGGCRVGLYPTNENIPNLKLNLNSPTGRTLANICNSKSNYNLWHKRLGHTISIDKFNELKNENMFFDSKLIEAIKSNNERCETCICGKQARLPSNSIKDKTHINRPLLNVHSDICGPITPSTIDNKSYFMVFIYTLLHTIFGKL